MTHPDPTQGRAAALKVAKIYLNDGGLYPRNVRQSVNPVRHLASLSLALLRILEYFGEKDHRRLTFLYVTLSFRAILTLELRDEERI